jgi:hypothetical protein
MWKAPRTNPSPDACWAVQVIDQLPEVPAAATGSREVQGLLKMLSSRWLIDQLARLQGYDSAHCGERVAAFGAWA